MEKDHLARILKRNPNIDRTASDRSQQATKQLAEVGVKDRRLPSGTRAGRQARQEFWTVAEPEGSAGIGVPRPQPTTSPIIPRTLPTASSTSNGKQPSSKSRSPANLNLTISRNPAVLG